MEEMMLSNLYKVLVQWFQEPEKRNHGSGLKISLKQMLQTLAIALAHVKAGNNSENLSNEIRQIVCFLYQSKEVTKKVYNKIIQSIQR